MKPQVLVDYIIKPSLAHLATIKLKADSPASRQFMLAVAAIESRCGEYFKQMGNGPALGIWQVEPATSDDIYEHYLSGEIDLRDCIDSMMVQVWHPGVQQHIVSPMYNCAIARMCVYRQADPMPDFGDKDGMWSLYKKYFNSSLGASTYEKWCDCWDEFVEGVSCI